MHHNVYYESIQWGGSRGKQSATSMTDRPMLVFCKATWNQQAVGSQYLQKAMSGLACCPGF